MVQGPASRKIHFSIDDKDGRDELTTTDGLQLSLFGSVNDKKEIDKGFEVSETDSKRIKLMGYLEEIGAENVSEKSSPLGLTLRKTPSFLDLIEMKLSQGRNLTRSDTESEKEKSSAGSEEITVQPTLEKLKASNFPANFLRIGTWERVTIYEGDLVAKCYYAKRKLVWEVLERGLKSKIEIQWSDISAIRATFRKNEADILEIELCRAPMFFRETNPQPRKHTLWQTASDFTGGQAPIYRRHYVKFPEGTLERHYEKLLQCDNRLMNLSKKPFPPPHSPYFYSNLYGYPDTSFSFNGHRLLSQFPHLSLPRPNAMLLHQLQNFDALRPPFTVNDSTSPMSVMDFPHIKENGITYSRQQHQRAPIWVQGISNGQNIYSRKGEVGELPSILSTRQGIPPISQHEVYHQHMPCGGQSTNNILLSEIADQLLNDPFASALSDEQRVLAKVRSMDNLLDTSKESIPTSGNAGGANVERSIGGSDLLCPQPLNFFPTQGSNENQLMNLTRCSSFTPFFVDPAMEDAASVDPANEVKQW
ncbi:uncharacterized protein LOC122085461 [Macadamia integrifolia]|uniref:uncharacterized protein LOC122085461 n=1 Tax=Macadamia integrifolia TaxID=60698 RepID=UPI001C4E5CC0|nr:uncharacterized protein LOC122085461 [Macadamia integrifolia]